MTKDLYAVHSDGRKLYYPHWNGKGEVLNSSQPLAAVSIDENGNTFPKNSIWIRGRSWKNLLPGWKLMKHDAR